MYVTLLVFGVAQGYAADVLVFLYQQCFAHVSQLSSSKCGPEDFGSVDSGTLSRDQVECRGHVSIPGNTAEIRHFCQCLKFLRRVCEFVLVW